MNDITDFNALHSCKHDHEMQLIAFEVLATDGDDLRRLSRKTSVARLLRGRPDGIFANHSRSARSARRCFARV